jgi:hypothetical protein
MARMGSCRLLEKCLIAFRILKQNIQLTAAGGFSRLSFTMATSMTVQSKDDLQRVELGFRSGVLEFLIALQIDYVNL